ncbi:MAG: helix-turn-helix domain-containing protein [Subdoligranulum sp.]|nr:helix-turn-helix domain-containing protein [Subdoligranulum sp.]
MVLSDRLELFHNMLQCCHTLYLWAYDAEMNLLGSSCPEESTVSALLSIGDRLESTRAYAGANRAPLLLSNEMGLMWIADPERDEKGLRRIYILGPFFMDSVSANTLEHRMAGMGLSAALQANAMRFFRALPVISLSRALEYASMLHYCICGERIGVSDMNYWESGQAVDSVSDAGTGDLHGTYEAEQEMLRMVREGDWQSLKGHMDRMSTLGTLGKLSNGDVMRQMRNAVEACITLFSRAAIEGGLAPEVSYTLTDHYYQRVEACASIAELTDVSMTMQEDFVQRVARCRQNPALSKPVRACIDYIDLHLEDDLTLQTLAGISGYSEYYISKRFKKEAGETPKEYLRKKRLERAKFLLRASNADIQKISERLRFYSQSYFSEMFRKEYGITPTQWREQAAQDKICIET